MSDFLKDIIKETGNEYASLVSEGVEAGDVHSYIDTGSYALNALLSGSIFGGLPSNKITALAGEAATGKTFFALGIIKHFLDKNKDGGVVFFESESALTKDLVESRGINSKRVVIVPVSTVQEFRYQAIRVLDKYIEQKEEERKPIMFVLDSLGMLSTTKEMEDTAEGKETRDMTRSQIVKAAFRVLTLKLGKAKVPMIMTNHTYSVIGSMFPQKEMGGGSGLKYAASNW
jgi:RecA/RadA recombinase